MAAHFQSMHEPEKLYWCAERHAQPFQVQATDLANNTDPSPATYSWTVDVAADYQVLHYFGQRGPDTDGGSPLSTVTLGSDGFLSGTTQVGRLAPCSPAAPTGCYNPPVFKVDPAGNFVVLDQFKAFDVPWGQLIQARDGNFYGTDAAGPNGFGSIFKIDRVGHITKLHELNPGEGVAPKYGVTQGADGFFYGTTSDSPLGPATLFRMDSAGQLTVLHVFDPGETPVGTLIQAPDGNLYGTTSIGGGGGTVYRSTTSGAMTVLHNFDAFDMDIPQSGLLLASDGFLYGKALGFVFKIDAAGSFSVVHQFDLNAEGFSGTGQLIQGTDGSLYGSNEVGGQFGGGAVFRMDLNGNVTTLHSFGTDGDGFFVMPGVVQGSDGALYGTTQAGPGGFGAGTVFRLALSASAATSALVVSPASGNVGGTTTLSAALSASGSPVVGRIVTFTLNGVGAGSATTDAAGVASVTGVSLAGLFAGAYPNAIQASFAGDESFTAATAYADLTVTDVGTPAQPTRSSSPRRTSRSTSSEASRPCNTPALTRSRASAACRAAAPSTPACPGRTPSQSSRRPLAT